MDEKRVIIGQMEPRRQQVWEERKNTKNNHEKRLQRRGIIFAAVALCTVTGIWFTANKSETVQAVMSHVTASFEYDDTLGRLQFVSNILPESVMVFLEGETMKNCLNVVHNDTEIRHVWSAAEPWIEYACNGAMMACQEGEVTTVVQSRKGEYTVRILHEDSCESIYSGLKTVSVSENEWVSAGAQIGTATGNTAFEWRKDGLSVQPVFGDAM